MAQISANFESRQTPLFEEKIIPETQIYDFQYENQTNDETHLMDTDQLTEGCCLCPEGAKIQNTLIEHLQLEHQSGEILLSHLIV